MKGQAVPFETDVLHALTREDRLLVDDEAKCWPWRGGVTGSGYGMCSGQLVHRLVYELIHGPIPTGLTIDHLCRNKRCANPSHLEAVTSGENTRRAQPSHCKHGHPLNHYQPNGRRVCPICKRASGRRSYHRRKGAA